MRTASGSHPVNGGDPVRRAVRSWLSTYTDEAAPIVVACSGGADSLALALAAMDSAGSRPLGAATVDHGLQHGSAEHAAATAELLRDLGFPAATVLTVTVAGPGGLEAAARRARYAALRQFSESMSLPGHRAAVLLAHTTDDQAETVLLGLGRGSGPRSIAGMRPWRAPWGRPLLGVRRSDTENACRRAGLTPWQDPHNSDHAFTRVRLRRAVLPLLEEVLGGGVAEALTRTAELMAQDLDALDELASALRSEVTGPDGALNAPVLARHPDALIARVLRIWVTAGGAGPLTFDQLSRMGRMVVDGRPRQVRLAGGLDVVRTGDAVRLTPGGGGG